MNEHLDPTGENFSNTEREIERKLRPLSFDDFTGQVPVLENLKIFVEAAKMRDEAMDHVDSHEKSLLLGQIDLRSGGAFCEFRTCLHAFFYWNSFAFVPIIIFDEHVFFACRIFDLSTLFFAVS